MVLMKKKKLLVSIYNYVKGMYMIFNGININGRQIWEITDNRHFWKTILPIVLDKGVNTTKISLVDEEKTVTQDKKVADFEPVF